MRLLARAFMLNLLIFGLPAFSPALPQSDNPIVVKVAVQDWLTSYLDWTHNHPGTLKQDAEGSYEPLTLPMPYIELFSPSGESLYRGGSDKENAAFLDGIKHDFPPRSSPEQASLKPSLSDLLAMVSELKPYRSELLQDKRYKLFAITYLDKPICHDQNEAMQRLTKRADLQVIEMDLQRK